MMKNVLICGLLLAAGLIAVPAASAECEPSPFNPDYCDGRLQRILDKIPDPRSMQCWAYDDGSIRCEW